VFISTQAPLNQRVIVKLNRHKYTPGVWKLFAHAGGAGSISKTCSKPEK